MKLSGKIEYNGEEIIQIQGILSINKFQVGPLEGRTFEDLPCIKTVSGAIESGWASSKIYKDCNYGEWGLELIGKYLTQNGVFEVKMEDSKELKMEEFEFDPSLSGHGHFKDVEFRGKIKEV